MNCPQCGSDEIRKSQSSSWADIVQQLRGEDAFRCRKCRKRFYASRAGVGTVLPSRPRRSKSRRDGKRRIRLLGWILSGTACVVILLVFILHSSTTDPSAPVKPLKEILYPFSSAYWKFPTYPGLRNRGGSLGLRAEFSGTEPDDCMLAEQAVFLLPGPYTLTYTYETSSLPKNSGIKWQIMDTKPGAAIAESQDLSSDKLIQSSLDFTVPDDVQLIRVRVSYHNSGPSPAISGKLIIQSAQIHAHPQP